MLAISSFISSNYSSANTLLKNTLNDPGEKQAFTKVKVSSITLGCLCPHLGTTSSQGRSAVYIPVLSLGVLLMKLNR